MDGTGVIETRQAGGVEGCVTGATRSFLQASVLLLTGSASVAEYFRDAEGADTLLFIVDNIFRFTQAGSEVSALVGPHAERGRPPAKPGDGNG